MVCKGNYKSNQVSEMGLKKVLMFHATIFKVTRKSNTTYDDGNEGE